METFSHLKKLERSKESILVISLREYVSNFLVSLLVSFFNSPFEPEWSKEHS